MASLELLTPHLSKINNPRPQQLVYKDECVYSFDNPESETGLYVSLVSFLGFGRNYVEQYFQKTGNAVFLHIKTDKELAPEPEQTGDGPEKKITRLAIGVEGGFDPDAGRNKYIYTEHHSVVVLPGFHTYAWPNDALPDVVKKSVQAVIEAESPFKLAEMAALAGTWDGEQREVSAHALDLKQLDNGVKVPPSGWQCAKCELTTNLWLNLTDGSILCGRKFFDGSGGNDHAVEHYKQTGYPLAVKLGTITADGSGDVFSYPEDDMVQDPLLRAHLLHFGIRVQQLEKTEKSMVELELELNQRNLEWSALQESGSALVPLSGPRLTGMRNLGNSCYINSVMQVMFRIPDFIRRFVDGAPDIFGTFPDDPVNDFNVQTAKLGVGLASGRYAEGVAPHMFRQLVGRAHPEFVSKRQQDAHEFYAHFLTLTERNSRNKPNPGECLRLVVEDRVRCGATGRVRYTRRTEQHVPLPVPLAEATNLDAVRASEQKRSEAEAKGQHFDPSQIVRPHIPFQACLASFLREEAVEQFYSTAADDKVTAHKITRLATFPDYLLVQLKKFTIKEDWTPAKLDVSVDMPWEVDLSCLRGHGQQPGEELLPESAPAEQPPPTFDEALLAELLDMGFPLEACKKALYFSNNGGLEAASHWLMEHMTDWDFGHPFQPPAAAAGAAAATANIDETSISQIMGMGFTRPQALKALSATGGAVDRAVDWIFSHADELDAPDAAPPAADPALGCRDGPEKYKLVAFISHMGTSSTVGHYVCHVLHDGRWVIFNDEKVALSENPPKDLGYLYLYERL
ncbi:ubiquitin carboxyl-terminal hydrolase 5 [Plutella xylostella]|uniref:ubiquitin carboxyl-terminal hydrolase 5 n=1 Tax=Plutella xylostella TaxID=51655 RepID=UPI002032E39E|nr:ubiquitin carboxyl-terminal hydrolase 5 [Plutella xylostella]